MPLRAGRREGRRETVLGSHSCGTRAGNALPPPGENVTPLPLCLRSHGVSRGGENLLHTELWECAGQHTPRHAHGEVQPGGAAVLAGALTRPLHVRQRLPPVALPHVRPVRPASRSPRAARLSGPIHSPGVPQALWHTGTHRVAADRIQRNRRKERGTLTTAPRRHTAPPTAAVVARWR
jgi:hypothetical protein